MNKWNILIIDNDPFSLKFMTKSLEGPEINIIKIENELYAMDSIKKERPHMVIIDLSITLTSPFNLMRKIISNKTLKEVFIIATSANINADERISAYRSGANAFISKPFDISELRALCIGNLKRFNNIDKKVRIEKNCLLVGNHEIYLTEKEYRLMSILIENFGKSINKVLLGNRNNVDVHLSNIRAKLKASPLKIVSPAQGLLKIIDKKAS